MAFFAARTWIVCAATLTSPCLCADPRALFRQRQVTIRSEGPHERVIAQGTSQAGYVSAAVGAPGELLWLGSGEARSDKAEPFATASASEGRRLTSSQERPSNATLLQSEAMTTSKHRQRMRQLRKVVAVLRWAAPIPAWRRMNLQPSASLGFADKQVDPHFTMDSGINKQPAIPQDADFGWWMALFIASCIAMGIYVRMVHNRQVAECMTRPSEDDVIPESGRSCYLTCYGIYMFLLAIGVFHAAFLVVCGQNYAIEAHPGKVVDKHGDVAQINADPGADAYEAGCGVALSVVMACLVVFAWRWDGNVNVSNAALAQFAVRGASLSLFIAALLEIIGEMMLSLTAEELEPAGTPLKKVETTDDIGWDGIWVIFLFLIAGVAEELAKIVAVVWSLWFSVAEMSAAPNGCCMSCRMLLRSPRAVMLAGLSVGFAFMTIENSEYLLSVAAIPITTQAAESADDKATDAVATEFARLFVISVRVFLNIHPWLAGITSARVARIEFQGERQDSGLTMKELSWALAPSVLAHALYDTSVVILPGELAIFSPAVFWYFSRKGFAEEWKNFESMPAEREGHAPPAPPPPQAATSPPRTDADVDEREF